MQIVVMALCRKGTSLREAIGSDAKLGEFSLAVGKKKQMGRRPGWLKVHSTDKRRGAINVEWDSQAHVLMARVITRGAHRPSAIVGDFLNYLLARHRTRIVAITTALR